MLDWDNARRVRGFSLKKVNFGHFGSELAKPAASKRHRLALNPSVLPSPYYNIVKELPPPLDKSPLGLGRA